MTDSTRTVHCPNCGGPYEGDFSGADCRGCGDFRNPTDSSDMADLLLPSEVVRFSTGDIMVAMTPREGDRD